MRHAAWQMSHTVRDILPLAESKGGYDCIIITLFLSDPGIPGPIYGSGCLYVRDLVADLTDVTLVDEDTNSIPTNNSDRTIQDNVAMPVTNPSSAIWRTTL